MEPTSVPLPSPFSALQRRSLAALGAIVGLAVVGDFLFWGSEPGLSLGLFFIAAGGAILLAHRRKPLGGAGITAALLAATCIQSGVEISFSNLLVAMSLLVVLLGESAFGTLRRGWPRWSEAIWSMVKTPFVWKWIIETARMIPIQNAAVRRFATLALSVGLPALVLGGVFIALLSSGNAILLKSVTGLQTWLWEALLQWDLSFGRFLLWGVLLAFGVVFLRPMNPGVENRLWTRSIPSFPEPRELKVARWRSLAILIVLNVLFAVANTIDAAYLWVSQQVPEGVNYSEYVHQGVFSLTAAVVLSALVLASLFQQSQSLTGARGIRLLAYVWLGQNLLLIASVLLRLKLYVEAYQLSLLRIYVGCFLLLVTTGFLLLGWRIARDQSLNWLIFHNVLATFCLFFVLQFPDVARWVAEYNVARWQQNPKQTLDVEYLASLGSAAFPSLIAVAETPNRPEAHPAFLALQERKEYARKQQMEHTNWRSLQWRRDQVTKATLAHEIRTREANGAPR